MDSIDHYIRAALREEIRAAIGDEIRQLREEVAELRAGPPAELRGMLTYDQLGEYLGVSGKAAREWCHRNGVKIHEIGANRRILGEDVRRVLNRKK